MTHEFTYNGKYWKVSRLIELAKDLPLQQQFTSDLYEEARFKYPWNGMRFEDFIFHMENVNRVHLEDPILLDADGRIMDGYHRLAKAMILKKERIFVKQFLVTPEPDRIDGTEWMDEEEMEMDVWETT